MIVIPTRSDLSSYRFQVTIESVIYIFEFRWNTQFEFWTFDIYDFGSVPLITGVKLIVNYPLTKRYAKEELPPGELIAIDSTSTLDRVGRNDLGDKVQLIYMTEAEYDAIV